MDFESFTELLKEKGWNDSGDAQHERLKEAFEIIKKALKPSDMITCAYCGEEFPEGTYTCGDSDLTTHIDQCEYHPLAAWKRRAAESEKKVEAVLLEIKNVEQILGKTLGFPEHCSGEATIADGVCVDDNTVVTLAQMASAKICSLQVSIQIQSFDVCQTLGRVLRLPLISPDSEEVDIGEHTAETLVLEVERKVRNLREEIRSFLAVFDRV